MKIHLRQIPADGLHLEDEEECPLPQLNSEEARCAGPLRYSLDAGISEGALWANGELTSAGRVAMRPMPRNVSLSRSR